MIIFKNLTKKYKDVFAVSDLSLEIEDGEIFGLLGPNGAGKTTVILLISTVLKPTSGDAIVNSFSINTHSHRVREIIGIASQEAVLDPRLTVAQNLAFHAEACGIPKATGNDRIKEELQYIDMWTDRGKKAGKLSGGMKRKVENAKVFVQKPRIAIFDEPTAYLDPPSRLKVWKRIKDLQQDGSTIIIATNMMDEADQLCSNVAIVNKGKLVALGSPSRLKSTIPGGEVIQFKANEPIENVRNALTNSREVVSIATVKSANIVRVYVNQSEEALPIILKTLLEQKIEITSVDVKKPSLEDVFMHYTGEVLNVQDMDHS